MSNKWEAWAWEQRLGDQHGHKLVLLALADHAGDDGICWPGSARLAEKCEYAVETVVRYISGLEAMGLLRKVHRRRGTNGALGGWVYQLGYHQSVTNPTGTPVPVVPQYQWYPSTGTSGIPVPVGGPSLLIEKEESIEPSFLLPETSSGCQKPRIRTGTKSEHSDTLGAALMEACGLSYDDMPKRSRTAVATAAAELAALKPPVQPREVLRRASIYVDVFPGAALTPSALVKHWPALSRAKVVRQETPKRLSGLEAAIRARGDK